MPETFSGRTSDPIGDPCWNSLFLKDCTAWEGPTLGQFVENCLPWKGPHAGAGADGEKSSSEEEGATETTCDELTTAPVPHPPALLRGRRERIRE